MDSETQTSRLAYTTGQSSLGRVLVAGTGHALCAITLGDCDDDLIADLARRFDDAELVHRHDLLSRLLDQVIALIERPGAASPVPIDMHGTQFQKLVWKALLQVPAGQTVTYTELASSLGRPGSARAVAQACAANLLAVAIPCHRVIRADGNLSGYRWSVERKRQLLARESTVCRDRAPQ